MWLTLCRSRYFLEKWSEGLNYVKKGLVKCPGDKRLIQMQKTFEDMLKHEQIIIKEVASLQAQKEDVKLKVYRKLRENKIKLGKKVHHLPESLELQITLDDYSKLHFPVLLLYDEFMMTDFIQDWEQDVTLREQLAVIF